MGTPPPGSSPPSRKTVAKVNIGPLEDEKGDVITGNEKMAEALNRYFVSIFTVEDTNDMPKN